MKIYCVVDSVSWCWATTAKEIAKRLPQHTFFMTSRPRLAEAAKFDLIWMRGYPYIFRNAFKAGVPVVWTFATGGARAQAQIERCRPFFGSGATVICQNRKSQALLEAEGVRNVVVIPNGVDGDRYFPAETFPEDFVVGMAANVNGERWRNKGADVVVEACRSMGISLRMATSPKHGCASKAHEFDNGRIANKDMPAFLRGLSVFAQPSSAEGCSNSIMEAMACGLPCIICRESGYHGEVCSDGIDNRTGEVLFVDHGDVRDVSATLGFLSRRPEQAARIGANARRFALEHSWSKIAKRFGDAFSSAEIRAEEFHLVTFATEGYSDCLRKMLPTWTRNSGASSITVVSDCVIDGLPDAATLRNEMPRMESWLHGCMAKALVLKKVLLDRKDGDRIVFLDADCAVVGDLRPFANAGADLALTRFSTDSNANHRHRGTCAAGALAFTVSPRTRRFIDLWGRVQASYSDVGHGVQPGKVACDQYALTDLARGRACGVTVRAMDERVWNSNPETTDAAWLVEIAAQRPAVLHFKGGRWKNEDLVRRAIAEGERA